jgi:hypothetical protein
MSKLSKGTIIGGCWKVEELIGEGACGRVYSVSPTTNQSKYDGSLYVAKCIPDGSGLKGKALREQERICNTLNHERNLLAPGKLLHDFKYRPQLPPLNYHGNISIFHYG